MVVFDADHVVDGRGEVEVSTYDAVSGRAAGVRSVRLPAVHVPVQGQRYVTGWLSPQAAARVGVPVGSDGTVVTYDVPPDDDTEEAISAALVEQGQDGFFRVERGYRDAYGVGLLALLLGSAVVTLGAAAVATGLAQADGRADQATLAAVGADPRLRRRLTAFQAAVVAGLGAAARHGRRVRPDGRLHLRERRPPARPAVDQPAGDRRGRPGGRRAGRRPADPVAPPAVASARGVRADVRRSRQEQARRRRREVVAARRALAATSSRDGPTSSLPAAREP